MPVVLKLLRLADFAFPSRLDASKIDSSYRDWFTLRFRRHGWTPPNSSRAEVSRTFLSPGASSKALEEKVRELTGEREQILAVISEKTKENRQLKDENRRMVDVTAANENALSKVGVVTWFCWIRFWAINCGFD